MRCSDMLSVRYAIAGLSTHFYDDGHPQNGSHLVAMFLAM